MSTTPLADYDKFQYDYEKYWQDQKINRQYEDRAERIALKKMFSIACPPEADTPRTWFCDLGTGFGRLFDVYKNRFNNIILADYSIENLKKAQKRIKNYEPARLAGGSRIKNIPKDPKDPKDLKDPNIYFIALNAYNLPFKDNSLDCLMTIRMLHHVKDVPSLFKEISRTLKPKGKFILEYPNKRHFLEVVKAIFGKSKMKPFSLEPTERGEGPFYNFHPQYIESRIKNQELRILKTLSVSNLRHKIFKKLLPLPLMFFLEKNLQILFSPIKLGPSTFILAQKKSPQTSTLKAKSYKLKAILICPKCKNPQLNFSKLNVKCPKCRSTYKIIDNIYDFRV